jgi:nucleoside-diphosphate-sugar epimerase
MSSRFLITGATGCVGSNLAAACAERGIPAAALVRPTSQTADLEKLGLAVHRGELTDPALLRRALADADVVVHCAAKVGDWGPVEEYRATNVEGLRALLDACRERPLKRFVHISTLGVYAARDHHGTDETEPLPERHFDGYTQSKVEAERLALDYQRQFGVPVTVLRPGFVYGLRDRTVLPPVAERMRKGQLMYVGSADGAMNTIFVGNLVAAILLAAEAPAAVGQVYNVTDGEPVSKRRFFEAIADGLGLPRPKHTVPMWLGRFSAPLAEGLARMLMFKTAPRITRARLKLLALNLDFSIEKAKRDLGYAPRVSFADGMRQAAEWYKSQHAPV